MENSSYHGSHLPADKCPTVRSALDGWKTARTLLTEVINYYMASCMTLHRVCTMPMHLNPESFLVEEALAAVDSELQSLATEEMLLCFMRAGLATMRNHSQTLTKASTLPPEILTRIFVLSKTFYCAPGDRLSFYNFARVCRHWREIAITRPELWTHMDVGPGTPGIVRVLPLLRGKDRPIYVHLHEMEPGRDNLTPDHEVSKAISLLTPHMDRVYALNIESTSPSRNFASALLNLWLGSSNPDLVRFLRVYRPMASTILSSDGQSRNGMLATRSESAGGMLRSLSRLHLQNVKLDWDSGAFQDLVDLRLAVTISVSVSQVADILSANPELSILKLSRLTITRPEGWRDPEPVLLRRLHSLFFADMGLDSLQLLLPLIGRSTPPTELGLGIVPLVPLHDDLRAFLTRTGATGLYCFHIMDRYSFPTWLSLLRSLPSLRNLVLNGFHMSNVPVNETGAVTSQPSPSPHLPNITLLECKVTLEGLADLVAEHGIRCLRLENCQVLEGNDGNLEDLRASLLEVYPELNCIVSDMDSTVQWDYCHMFD
ncbi:hypothetical protein FRC08_011980 [Ceratobasidium sp. 394]|nr:hypothetical protein FRC08_011980 [Ceratobasidium sp. 394]